MGWIRQGRGFLGSITPFLRWPWCWFSCKKNMTRQSMFNLSARPPEDMHAIKTQLSVEPATPPHIMPGVCFSTAIQNLSVLNYKSQNKRLIDRWNFLQLKTSFKHNHLEICLNRRLYLSTWWTAQHSDTENSEMQRVGQVISICLVQLPWRM